MIRNRYIVVVVVVWLFSLLYMGFIGSYNDAPLENLKLELYEKTMKQLLELKEQNRKLINNIQDLKKTQEMMKVMNIPAPSQEQSLEPVKVSIPSMHHEILRRRVQSDVRESWFFIHHQLESLKTSDPKIDLESKLTEIQSDFFEYYSITSNDLVNLSRVDGVERWRREQSRRLAGVVQDVIDKLQNPEDCDKARLLVCTLDKGCGFGCQLHHVLFCMITAMATNRTFVLNSKRWRYLPDGWSKVFIPPSTKCDGEYSNAAFWTGNDDTKRIIQLPIIDILNPRPNFLPLAVPSQLYPTLVTIHGDPFVWWAGHLLTYLMRPQPSLAEDMAEVDKQLGFSECSHIVGVHIRRTDKLASEASFHSLSEYMWHVERYYDKLDLLTGVQTPRTIYLASDDPLVFTEATNSYPHYKVIGSKQFAIKAAVNSRYTKDSLRSIILDVHFLSRTNHLVCTFSSQVSRLAYELMQTLHRDDATSFTSLDDMYYYGGQNGHKQVARFDHIPRQPGYVSLTRGEFVGVAGNHWDGFSMGSHAGASDRGLYPSIKVLEHIPTASFGVFDEFFKSEVFKKKYGGVEFGGGDGGGEFGGVFEGAGEGGDGDYVGG